MSYDTVANAESIQKVIAGLKERGSEGILVGSKAEALQKIKSMIPAGSSVMNGASRTLEEIGYIDLLKEGKHGWSNLHDAILDEKDPAKQAELRKQSVISDYYLGSVHALSETGEFVVASNTGSQMPHLVFTSPNLILVVGAQKIVPNLTEAMNRLEQHVFPLEDARMKGVYGMGSSISKVLIFHREAAFNKRNITLIIVGEKLGF